MAILKKEKLQTILQVTESLNQIKDIDSLLDRILLESRRFMGADAGSIYLVQGNCLRISYVQNDSMLKGNSNNRLIYQNHEVPIDEHSMSGYVAYTKKPLIIADAYAIPATVPYQFNRSFDIQSAYRTHAVMSIPLITVANRLIGVLQLINPLNEAGVVVPFSEEDCLLGMHFAIQAASAIERAQITRETILRMIKIAQLHDPKETGGHVNRVGAYSIEIYQKWASDHGVDPEEIKRQKDALRIAAMLHDVGKVAISDLILKKSEKLSADEFGVVQMHTVLGARLFSDSSSDVDAMAGEIALNHHEKWDGSGYPGQIRLDENPIRMGKGKKADEIPLMARIVAVADVFDALITRRIYKDGWAEEKVLEYLEEQKASHFDPEIVQAFISIYDIILAIHRRYPD
jgi:HD-GYP domain-containing protein (c-di-GMP phosphodiesterase class II)